MVMQWQVKAQPQPRNFKGITQETLQQQHQTARGLQGQLHKTKFCVFSLKGACQYGDKCAFAHSAAELQDTPDLKKTKLCAKFVQAGACDNEHCPFAHGCEELRSTNMFYKKTLCIWHEKGGKCRNGSTCHFAHGIQELRGAGTSSAGQSTKQPSTTSGTTTPEDEEQRMQLAPLRIAPAPRLAEGGGRSQGRHGDKALLGNGVSGHDRGVLQFCSSSPSTAEPMKVVPNRTISGATAVPAWGSSGGQEYTGACTDLHLNAPSGDELKAEIDRLTGLLSALATMQADTDAQAATALEQQGLAPSALAAMWQWGMDPYMPMAHGGEWQSHMAWQQEVAFHQPQFEAAPL